MIVLRHSRTFPLQLLSRTIFHSTVEAVVEVISEVLERMDESFRSLRSKQTRPR